MPLIQHDRVTLRKKYYFILPIQYLTKKMAAVHIPSNALRSKIFKKMDVTQDVYLFILLKSHH